MIWRHFDPTRILCQAKEITGKREEMTNTYGVGTGSEYNLPPGGLFTVPSRYEQKCQKYNLDVTNVFFFVSCNISNLKLFLWKKI